MRLKSFRAATVAEAMQLVRDHFGDNAVIVSTQRGADGEGVRVTAAVDDSDYEPDLGERVSPVDAIDAIDAISQSLEYHRLPTGLADQLLSISSNLLLEDPGAALAVALDGALGFDPLPHGKTDRPIMFVGPPGVGKTVSLAKLAVRSTFAQKPVAVITTDTVRAGGIDQLAAFTNLLNVELQIAETPSELTEAIRNCRIDDLILIDTPSTNPFDENAMGDLAAMIRTVSADPVLVLNAGLDTVESEEIGKAFRKIGCTRLLVSRLDVSRRLGSVIATAHAARLKLCDMTNTPQVTQGLIKLNPLALARMLLPDMSADRAHAAAERALGEHQAPNPPVEEEEDFARDLRDQPPSDDPKGGQ